MNRYWVILVLAIALGSVTSLSAQSTALIDSLVQARMQVLQLRADTASTGREVRYLRSMLAVHSTLDSVRTENAILKVENRRLKKKLLLESGVAVIVTATSVYLLLK